MMDFSFTNNSLYTAFQRATCFDHSPIGARYGTINPDFGLDRGKQYADPIMFWRSIEDYLATQAERHAKSDVRPPESYIIVLAGEAAENREFMDTVRKVVARIQGDEAHKSERTGSGPNIELFVSQEPIFAAAIGAAFSKRRELDSSYCDEYHESGRKVVEDLEDNHRDEL